MLQTRVPYKFYIIYTPQTVKVLYPFLLSFFDRTDMRVHLVANGCFDHEIKLLEGLADIFPSRAELTVYSDVMRRHPEVLDYLQQNNKEPIFAFMDSDIMLGMKSEEMIRDKMKEVHAFFSGPPLWMRSAVLPRGRDKAGGRFMITSDGYCLGGTYFAIYQNNVVSEMRDRYNVGFSHQWWKDLSRSIRKPLISEGQKYVRYDNGKVLNILLQHHGFTCNFEDRNEISHFGGLSRFNSVLKQNESRLTRHSKERPEQKDMQILGEFMSKGLEAVISDQKLPEDLALQGHFAFEKLSIMLSDLKSLRARYRDDLLKLGL